MATQREPQATTLQNMKLTTYELSDIKNARRMPKSQASQMRESWCLWDSGAWDTSGKGTQSLERLESSHMGIPEFQLWKAVRNTMGDAFGKMTEERW